MILVFVWPLVHTLTFLIAINKLSMIRGSICPFEYSVAVPLSFLELADHYVFIWVFDYHESIFFTFLIFSPWLFTIRFHLFLDSMNFILIKFSPIDFSIIKFDNSKALSFSLLINIASVETFGIICPWFTELQFIFDCFQFTLNEEFRILRICNSKQWFVNN